MKKRLLIVLSLVVFLSGTLSGQAANKVNGSADNVNNLNVAIKYYKGHNYASSYKILKDIVEKDPSNALAYYYLAMTSAQLGNKSDAITNYNRVIVLSPNGKLAKYALKGKVCLEDFEKCHQVEAVDNFDNFVKSPYGTGFSNKVRSDYEKYKIENFMREMNRSNNLEPKNFKDYKDFSYETPSNDEIVAALRVLQRAGLTDVIGMNNMTNMSSILPSNYNNVNNPMMNMLTGAQNSSLDSNAIQALLTNQMSLSF